MKFLEKMRCIYSAVNTPDKFILVYHEIIRPYISTGEWTKKTWFEVTNSTSGKSYTFDHCFMGSDSTYPKFKQHSQFGFQADHGHMTEYAEYKCELIIDKNIAFDNKDRLVMFNIDPDDVIVARREYKLNCVL